MEQGSPPAPAPEVKKRSDKGLAWVAFAALVAAAVGAALYTQLSKKEPETMDTTGFDLSAAPEPADKARMTPVPGTPPAPSGLKMVTGDPQGMKFGAAETPDGPKTKGGKLDAAKVEQKMQGVMGSGPK